MDKDLNYGDHRLITIKTNIKIENFPRRRYRTKNISFKKLNNQIARDLTQANINFKNIQTTQQFEETYEEFYKIVIQNCNTKLQ